MYVADHVFNGMYMRMYMYMYTCMYMYMCLCLRNDLSLLACDEVC